MDCNLQKKQMRQCSYVNVWVMKIPWSTNMLFFFQVTDSKSHILYSKEDAKKGRFAFTTEEYDMFEVCFDTKMVGGKCCLNYT